LTAAGERIVALAAAQAERPESSTDDDCRRITRAVLRNTRSPQPAVCSSNGCSKKAGKDQQLNRSCSLGAGGAAYFLDPDGHLLEYIAMLEGEPRPDEGLVEWHACHES
jgi:hypothetical protein